MNPIRRKFAWIEAVLADRDLSYTEKLVAISLALHSNDATDQCNPSRDRLARKTGLSLRTVGNAVGELRQAGWITSRKERSGNGFGASAYMLAWDRAHASADSLCTEDSSAMTGKGHADALSDDSRGHQDARCEGTKMPTARGHRDAHKQIILRKENLNTRPPYSPPVSVIERLSGRDERTECDPVGQAFREFWSHYPRKEARDGAEREFRKAIKDERARPDELIEGAKRTAAWHGERGTEQHFIPSAANWLRDGRWKDQLHEDSSPRFGRPRSRNPRPLAGAYAAEMLRQFDGGRLQ